MKNIIIINTFTVIISKFRVKTKQSVFLKRDIRKIFFHDNFR